MTYRVIPVGGTFELSRPEPEWRMAREAYAKSERHAGGGALERRAGGVALTYAIGSTRCRRFSAGANGSGQYSTSRTILPLSTVKKETGSATNSPSVTLT